MRVLNAGQMQEADRLTIEDLGIPSIVLMENAGRAVVHELASRFHGLAFEHTVILCGRGNNGGDGFVVARVMAERGYEISVYLIGRAVQVRGDSRQNMEILNRLEIPIVEIANEGDWEPHADAIRQCDVIVDALFGTGLKEPLSGLYARVVKDINAMAAAVVSVDVPSGLSCDTHQVIGEAVNADVTVALAAAKLPHVLPPAEGLCGDLAIVDIGIPGEIIDELEGPRVERLGPAEIMRHLMPRDPDANKGDFGRVVVAAGSLGKSGAAHLAAMAALRSGAGLVTVATPRSCLPIVAAMAPEYMTEPWDEDASGGPAESAIDRVLGLKKDVLAVGPGLGQGERQQALVFALLDRSDATLVFDADALNAFQDDPSRLHGREGVDVIITPHPGEMARLTGLSIDEVQQNRLEVARNFAMSRSVFVVLKGHRTLIAAPDGRVAINPTGNPGMATGGTGDVLTGIIAAWYGQLLDADAACRVGVYLHGLAGDLARRHLGESALIASDIIARLGEAAGHVFRLPGDEAADDDDHDEDGD
jgi:ADP-dependent NAD(P)H-hydrate dehydratase / NAD(P)H-hydrate epimerase